MERLVTRVIIAAQYDLLGQITEYVVALDCGATRLPIAQCERFPEAQELAREARREHRASRITVEMEGA